MTTASIASTGPESSIHREVKDDDGRITAVATTGTSQRALEIGEQFAPKHDLPGFGDVPCDWLD